MATHGKAREMTINALRNLEPFKRSGFAMTAVSSKVDSIGRLSENKNMAQLYADSDIKYTVLSYSTVIAWVTQDGETIVPVDRYSVTTTHHQNLCHVYLNN